MSAELDDFFSNDAPPAQMAPAAVADPAAEFLAAEQSDLAQIEAVYDEVPADDSNFDQMDDGFGAGNNVEEPVEDLGFIETGHVIQSEEPVEDLGFIESGNIIQQEVSEPEPVTAAWSMPKIEPEILIKWREEFKLRTEEIENNADREAEKWRESAKESLDAFYAERDEKLAKNKTLNRENDEALRVTQEDFNPADGKNDAKKWEMVTQRIDFNAKGSCTKDTSRMRQVLLQLKSGTIE